MATTGHGEANMTYSDQYLGKTLREVDPAIDEIIAFEEERQARKLILIPSESMAPKAVRVALGSVFNNVYAEGYPPLRMTRDEEALLLDTPYQLAYYRRYADRRFYKGVDYVHFVETLAQRRAAACFANERVAAEDIYVNVQPLSGSAANLSVYDTLLGSGDTVMGMDLYQGGHLTHGSEFNFSGKRFRVVSYGVSKRTGKLDYDEIRDLARQHRPKMIIAGFTSYTWAPDWFLFAEIAREVGAKLLADISHPAGLAIAGAYPSPVGIADVMTFTTHKTLFGPRGAVIMTTDEELANRIDLGVFPGQQGGPHTQKFAAMAVAFKIAQSPAFKRLQHQIKENAAALADGLVNRGLKLAYGGTDTHFCMLDLNSVKSDTGSLLRGEPAVRLLDMAGIVANKNTIPGDAQTALAMGIRLGSPWLTQRGFGPAEMDEVARLIHKTVTHIKPFSYMGLAGELPRGKVDMDVFEEIKLEVAQLAENAPAETANLGNEYPHYFHLARPTEQAKRAVVPGMPPKAAKEMDAVRTGVAVFTVEDCGLLLVSGDRDRVEPAMQQILTCDVGALAPGQCCFGFILDRDGIVIDDVTVMRLPEGEGGRVERFLIRTQPANRDRVKAWVRALADGYTLFDPDDLLAKIEGPLMVEDLSEGDAETAYSALVLEGPNAPVIADKVAARDGVLAFFGFERAELIIPNPLAQAVYDALLASGATPIGPGMMVMLRIEQALPDYQRYAGYGPESGRPSGLDLFRRRARDRFELRKPYFIGQHVLASVQNKPEIPAFRWEEPADAPLLRTPLYDWHKANNGRVIPFAGWEMPVWYTGVLDEHRAVRHAAGLFDVAHMGVFEVSGPHATEFLDLVCSNYVRWYEPGESFYSYLLDPDGAVIDDLLVYRRTRDRYLIVVNASNADKDWAWLTGVNNGELLLDRERPDLKVLRPATLRNLKDPGCGPDMRVDLALQGPASLEILKAMTDDERLRDGLTRVRKTGLIECDLAGFDLVVSRTGYTGEDMGFELFIHPDRAVAFWDAVMEAGKPFGLQPCGLAARDSTRTEAGLPLYGHELAGPFAISPAGAGFSGYVKLHKPYFIGRAAHIAGEERRDMEITRFRMNRTGVRMPKTGDPVVNRRGQAVGWVTSAAVDVDGRILGLAYIQRRYHTPGDELGIFSLPSKPLVEKENKADLQPGDKLQLPDMATILPRFPDAAERSHWSGETISPAPRFLPSGE